MYHVDPHYAPPRTPTPQLLTIGEVAALLRLHEKTVRRRINEGSIPAIRLGSGGKSQLRVPSDELERWLHE